jgi:hypothetical protein
VPDDRFVIIYNGGVRLQGRNVINVIDVCLNLYVVVKVEWSIRPEWNVL